MYNPVILTKLIIILIATKKKKNFYDACHNDACAVTYVFKGFPRFRK